MMEELHQYRQNLLEALATVVGEMQTVCAGIPTEAWHAPGNFGGITRHQILARLRFLEARAFYPRIVRILNEDCPHLPAINETAWEGTPYNPNEPPQEILAEYARLRVEELALLQDLPPAGWNRVGVHPGLGKRTLQWWTEHCLAYACKYIQKVAQGKEAV